MRLVPMTEAGLTLRQGRDRYFRENGFSEAGYSARWVSLKAGPFTFGFPNTEARRRAVKRHDLHHVLTGYKADWTGEAEIAAWELASGCGRFYAAWVLNLAAAAIGLFIAPKAVLRAWKKGRRENNLYNLDWDERRLEQAIVDVRDELCIILD